METINQKIYNEAPDKVFKALLDILNEQFEVKRIEEDVRTVEITTGMSWFSFGETFEIIVASQGNGSIVRVKGKSKVKWNITSEVEEKTQQIFELLDQKL